MCCVEVLVPLRLLAVGEVGVGVEGISGTLRYSAATALRVEEPGYPATRYLSTLYAILLQFKDATNQP